MFVSYKEWDGGMEILSSHANLLLFIKSLVKTTPWRTN